MHDCRKPPHLELNYLELKLSPQTDRMSVGDEARKAVLEDKARGQDVLGMWVYYLQASALRVQANTQSSAYADFNKSLR